MNDSTHKGRVAALQFGVTEDVAANLQTCLRLIDATARLKPALMVLPAFCNHFAWYRDREHCVQVAVERDGFFTQAIAAKAVAHQCFIQFNVTVRYSNGQVTATDLRCDPQGEVITIGEERNLLPSEQGDARGQITGIDFSVAQAGIDANAVRQQPGLAQMLMLDGAQILVSCLNSSAEDDINRHSAAQAVEHRSFVVAANTVGPLVPPEMIEMIADQLGIAIEQLQGAGASQIVAPDGEVIVKAPSDGGAILVIDLDPTQG